ncbi:hypothetical protein [Roseivivax isoporae]|uniref:Helix-turn-helix domain-containing protein n=1 Tax=Roseivivax isoporae LMG 25204 TaxID=1449351 RepID=X7F290_9RHOB|nr:hypothetical protein [Roseivivax isoporae]ETX26863.1 hypothetical protein RISW2_18885 [Roseivivax isoporae LMG 25204]
MNTTQLAEKLGLTKGRISQYVREGKLDGCYTGDGRQRSFDLDKVAARLGRRLDAGQMMGNGAETRRRLRDLDPEPAPVPEDPPARPDAELRKTDPDRYELARIHKAEEEARRLRRQNLEAEGTLVLADKVAQATARALAQEVAEFESVMRRAARGVADELGVDFKTVRRIMIESWRAHRGERAVALAAQAEEAHMDADERDADI